MCNAANHRPGCQCGWGGGYSGGVLSSSFQIYAGVPKIVARYESFVNSNASCPVCGENVYFYQSPLGGRVFFDNLGPPWPKHGCTNNTSIPKQIAHSQKPSQKNIHGKKMAGTLYSYHIYIIVINIIYALNVSMNRKQSIYLLKKTP